ncbi:MAG: EamA family transporter [Chloroflexi bacterium]|nr:MAG: EamA family transporter [Chloroflexota bacterium]
MKTKRGLVEIHIAAFLFGFAGLFGKLVSLNPVAIVCGRTFFAGLVLFISLSYLGDSIAVHSTRDLVTLCLSGLVLAVHWFTFFYSIQISTVAIGLLTFSTFPLFVTFMEPYFFAEQLRPFDIFVALIVVVGLVLVIPEFDFSNSVTQGVLWGVLAGFTFAILSLLNRKHVQTYSPLVVAFYQHVFAAIFTLPILVFMRISPTAKDVFLLAILGIFCTALAQTLFIGSLVHIKAQLASVISGLEPVYGVFFALVLLGEVPSMRTIVGGCIILGAVFLAMASQSPGSNILTKRFWLGFIRKK